jgi:branched-chain amino acid transport system substrate-binding protein
VIHAGPDQFRRALQLLREGKAIRYVGVIGPVAFDQNGDITGPFRKWRIQNGQVVTVGEMGIDEVNAVKARLPR